MQESEYISDFLNYLREVPTRLHIAAADEQEANAQTQDILHRLELHDDDPDETARLGELLRSVRRKRRVAKNTREALTPIADWAKDSESVKNTLERVLGDVRKIERRRNKQIYAPRTDILKSAAGSNYGEVADCDL